MPQFPLPTGQPYSKGRRRFILFQRPGEKTGQDLWVAPQSTAGGSAPEPYPYLNTQFDEAEGRFSPDGDHRVLAAHIKEVSGSGSPAGLSPVTDTNPSVTVGGMQTEVFYVGLTSGSIGLYQANFKVPQLTKGAYPVVLTIDGVSSNNILGTYPIQ